MLASWMVGACRALSSFVESHAPIFAYCTKLVLDDHSGGTAVRNLAALEFFILVLMRFHVVRSAVGWNTTVITPESVMEIAAWLLSVRLVSDLVSIFTASLRLSLFVYSSSHGIFSW